MGQRKHKSRAIETMVKCRACIVAQPSGQCKPQSTAGAASTRLLHLAKPRAVQLSSTYCVAVYVMQSYGRVRQRESVRVREEIQSPSEGHLNITLRHVFDGL